MIQSGTGGGFLREAVHAVAVGGNVVRENLERNLAMQFYIYVTRGAGFRRAAKTPGLAFPKVAANEEKRTYIPSCF